MAKVFALSDQHPAALRSSRIRSRIAASTLALGLVAGGALLAAGPASATTVPPTSGSELPTCSISKMISIETAPTYVWNGSQCVVETMTDPIDTPYGQVPQPSPGSLWKGTNVLLYQLAAPINTPWGYVPQPSPGSLLEGVAALPGLITAPINTPWGYVPQPSPGSVSDGTKTQVAKALGLVSSLTVVTLGKTAELSSFELSSIGASLSDVTSKTTFASSNPSDFILGNKLIFGSAPGAHTITGTLAGTPLAPGHLTIPTAQAAK